jgi:hypothetical protein
LVALAGVLDAGARPDQHERAEAIRLGRAQRGVQRQPSPEGVPDERGPR